MEDPEGVADRLAELRRVGICIDIDDFGTGYSSLGYLSTVPFDALKVPGVFVGRLSTAEGAEIVRAIVSLARSLGKPVVAEGVETMAQLETLASLGCRYAQGWLLAGALEPSACEGFLSRAEVPALSTLAARA